MSRETWTGRIEHMLKAIADVEAAVDGIDLDTFRGPGGRVRQNAVFWSFSVLGEAAKHVPGSVRERHPEVPWRLTRAMRNFLVHQYESIDLGIVWEAIQNDLPGLKAELERMLEDARKGSG